VSVDKDQIRKLLKKNKESLDIFKKATNIDYCDFTFGKYKNAPIDVFTEPITYFEEVSIVRLFILESMLLSENNNFKKAIENYITVLRFADHIRQQEGYSVLINIITSTMVEQLVSSQIQELITQHHLQEENHIELFLYLRNYKYNYPGLEDAFREETRMAINNALIYHKGMYQEFLYDTLSVQDLMNSDGSLWEKSKMIIGYFVLKYQPLRKKATENTKIAIRELKKALTILSNKRLEKQIKAYRHNSPELFKEAISEAFSRFKKEMGNYDIQIDSVEDIPTDRISSEIERFAHIDFLRSNPYPLARFFEACIKNTWGKDSERYYFRKEALDLLVVGCALELYRLNKGYFPDSLKELVPRYLNQIPVDYFSMPNKINYRKIHDGCMIWSVGLDRKDSDGKSLYKLTDEWQPDLKEKCGDLTLSLDVSN
jgi:transcriptional regulator of met regulon